MEFFYQLVIYFALPLYLKILIWKEAPSLNPTVVQEYPNPEKLLPQVRLWKVGSLLNS